ncbi:ATPase, partial [Aeromonas caviae]
FIKEKTFFKVSNKFNGHGSSQEHIYIPTERMSKAGKFHPVDKSGNEIDYLVFEFDKQGTCKISNPRSFHSNSSFDFKPEILFHKGDKKTDINQRLIDSLSSSVTDVRSQLSAILDKVETLQ